MGPIVEAKWRKQPKQKQSQEEDKVWFGTYYMFWMVSIEESGGFCETDL